MLTALPEDSAALDRAANRLLKQFGKQRTLARLLWIGPGSLSAQRELAVIAALGVAVTQVSSLEESPAVPLTPRFDDAPGLESRFDAVIVEDDVQIWMNYLRVFTGGVALRTFGYTTPIAESLGGNDLTGALQRRTNALLIPAFADMIASEPQWMAGITVEIGDLAVRASVSTKPLRSNGGQVGNVIAPVLATGDVHAARVGRFADELVRVAPRVRVLPIEAAVGRGAAVPLDDDTLAAVQGALAVVIPDVTFMGVPAHVAHALNADVPVLFFDGSLLSRLMPDSPGRMTSLHAASDAIDRLADCDDALADRLIREQRMLLHRIRNTQRRDAIAGSYQQVLRRLTAPHAGGPQQADPGAGWRQLERLMYFLGTPAPSSPPEGMVHYGRAATAAYHIILERDPSVEELLSATAGFIAGGSMAGLLTELLQSAEGSAAWPRNEFRAWLADPAR